MVELASTPGAYVVKGPMCNWGMEAIDKKKDPPEKGLVRKETGWMTNSKELAELLEGVCTNTTGEREWHKHVHLMGGIAKFAKVYPPALVEAVLRCLKDVMYKEGVLNDIGAMTAGPVPEEQLVPQGVWQEHWDDVDGGYLDPKLVEEAQESERDRVRKEKVMDIVDRSLAEEEGIKPISLRWVKTNKGDQENPQIRCRLVVREIKHNKGKQPLSHQELFSSMPPIEAFMFIVSLLASLGRPGKIKPNGKTDPYVMGFFDIKRAHFYGKAKRRIFVELEGPDAAKHGPGKVGLLNRSMYGTQDASAIWQDDYSEMLCSEGGFERGKSNGAVFYHPTSDTRVMVHGDDFAVLGTQTDVDNFEKMLASRYEYKRTACIGFGPKDDTTAVFLNRVVSLYPGKRNKACVEADSRHAQLIVRGLGLERGAKGVYMPSEKRSVDRQILDSRSQALNPEWALKYRSLVMRAAYLSQDRPDIGECCKGLARHMQQPNEADLGRLKRLGRYLLRSPSVVREFWEQELPSKITILVDTDHAGCALTRKSTTGMVALLGGHCIKHGSNLQTTVSLSSGESEYYGLVKGGCTGLGLRSLAKDWGFEWQLEVGSDSSAARGHVSRRGLGKMRHIQTRYLWLQERVGEGHLVIFAVPGKKNMSDVLTKAVSGTELTKHLKALGFVFRHASEAQKQLL